MPDRKNQQKTTAMLLPAAGLALCLLPMPGTAAEPPPTGIEEVLVTATLRERKPSDIAGTVSVISAGDIQSRLADDLRDLTRYQPGLDMASSARGGNQGFIIRGIGGNRVLTVIDGIRSTDIYAAGPSSYGKDGFEVDDLKAVEVIRGPASVLYGADAMGGAVLLRTMDPGDYLGSGQSHVLQFRTAGSSANEQLKTGLTWAGQHGNVGSIVQATLREYGETGVNGPGELNPQEGKSRNLLWKTRWEPGNGHVLTLTLDSNRERLDTLLENEQSASVSHSAGEDTSTRRRLSLSHEWQLNNILADSVLTSLHRQTTEAEQLTEQTRISYAFVDPRNPASYRGSLARRLSDFEFNQTTTNLTLVFSRQGSIGASSHDIVYGISHEETRTERPRNRCDTELATQRRSCAIPGYPFAPPEVFPNKTFPDTDTLRTGLFLQDEIRFADGQLTLIPGLRYDNYRMDPQPDALLNGTGDIADYGGYGVAEVREHELSGNLGLLYTLNDEYSLFAQYAEGFRPPNFDESNQAFVNLGHGYATIPNPDLEAEYSKGIEFGIRAERETLNLDLVLYANEYEQFIESRFIGTQNGISLFQDDNIGAARIHGAEASVLWLVNSNWQFRGSMAWSRGRNEISGAALDSIAPLTTVAGLRYTASDRRWHIEGIATMEAAQTRVSAPDRIRGDAWQTIDLIASYQLSDRASLRLGLFNLLDEDYARWSSIGGLAATDTRTLDNARAPGSNARLSLSYQLSPR